MFSSLHSHPYYLAAGLVACYAFVRLKNMGRRAKELPPGPPTVPILGNLHVLPKEFAHVAFTKWAHEYGEIFSLKMANGTAVVLTSVEAAREVLDRRSATTVDRPKVGNDAVSHHAEYSYGPDRASYMKLSQASSKNIVLSTYTDDWRSLRRTAHAALTPQASGSHLPIQLAESIQLLYDILHDPENFYTHIRREATSIILSVLYGRRAPRFGTREVGEFYHAQDLWTRVLDPGAVPATCREVRRLQRGLYFRLLGECEARLADGRHVGCFMEEVLERREEFALTRELAGYLGGALIEGGSDTTATYLQSFVLALLAHPAVQRKAQAEMDRVVGQERAPTLDDLPMLPYLQAVVKEVHRWRPVTPFGVPHAALADEWYKGHLIPKGSTIFVNQWGILHDENLYEHADSFEPERWLKNEFGVQDGVDTSEFRINLEFGYGRRVCPGMHVAKNTIGINTSRLVWAFNFEPVAGKAEDIDTMNYISGITNFPDVFQAKITPRSKQIAELIDHEFLAASLDFERYESLLSPEDKAHVQKARGAFEA
ncbi:cytochrome P450 [Auricularia subglabra TFB-10046 SS5]|nr:cytochrome P450 [Auricularia subglabra TFB-10046 SS5]